MRVGAIGVEREGAAGELGPLRAVQRRPGAGDKPLRAPRRRLAAVTARNARTLRFLV